MTPAPAPARALSVAILAMGGEGGGVLANWLVDLAEHAGWVVQATSVPGVAQRTGATIYYVELMAGSAAAAAGRAPVLALMPVPGDVDVVVASELMEAGRALQRGFVTPERTTLIASTHRVYSMTEKTAMADGRVDAARLIEGAGAAAKRFLHADFARLAEESGSVISATLFGALAASAALPFPRAQFEDAIRRGGVGVESSLRAFARGHDAALGAASQDPPKAGPPGLPHELRAAVAAFPAAARPTIEAGCGRLIDYQDRAYAEEYLERLRPLAAIEARAGDGSGRLLESVARHLALWLAYEDTVRVADLKIRRSRFARVAEEARVREGQVLGISEFLHPRVEEIADTLPAGPGRWLLATGWARRLVERLAGKGRVVETTSLRGFILLYAVASLRPLRRRSLRHGVERERIARWLATIAATAPRDYALALAIAECQQLVKGYSDTHARGLANFNAVMAALPRLSESANAAARVDSLRRLALADDTGDRLRAAIEEIPG